MSNCNYCDEPIDNNAIYRGEDTDAFGQNFLTINVNLPEGWVVSKAELTIGVLAPIIYNSPVFPLHVNLSRAQTKQLANKNKARLAIYDMSGKKKILDGDVIITTKSDNV